MLARSIVEITCLWLCTLLLSIGDANALYISTLLYCPLDGSIMIIHVLLVCVCSMHYATTSQEMIVCSFRHISTYYITQSGASEFFIIAEVIVFSKL